MTEQDWLACRNPGVLLRYLGRDLDDRSFALFLCACCRRTGHLWEQALVQHAVAVTEQWAEGKPGKASPRQAWDELAASTQDPAARELAGWFLADAEEREPALLAAGMAGRDDVFPFGAQRGEPGSGLTSAEQAALVRDIVGEPVRAVNLESLVELPCAPLASAQSERPAQSVWAS